MDGNDFTIAMKFYCDNDETTTVELLTCVTIVSLFFSFLVIVTLQPKKIVKII